MEAARRQLADGRGVSEAAMLCGYSDVCNFSKMFKRMYGVSPKNWKSNRENQ
jgi:AraC-like DNA-binding protein